VPGADAAAQGWKIAEPRDAAIRSNWWEMYKDPQLNDLEARVAISNQTIVAAEASYRAAYALVQEAQAQLFPTLSLDPSVTRAKSSAALTEIGGGGASTGAAATTTHDERRAGYIGRHAQYFRLSARSVLSGRFVGQHPQYRGRESFLRAGERGAAGECAAQHAEHAGAGLLPAAGGGRTAAHPRGDGRRL
jgi:hypothetical protein